MDGYNPSVENYDHGIGWTKYIQQFPHNIQDEPGPGNTFFYKYPGADYEYTQLDENGAAASSFSFDPLSPQQYFVFAERGS